MYEAGDKLGEEVVMGLGKGDLSEGEIEKLSDVVMEFAQYQTGIELYPYEYEFGWRVVYSLLVEDGDEITALFSRQSGKTEAIAVVVVGCLVMLPVFGKLLKDERIKKFGGGLWCGIYAPNYEQAGILWGRMRGRMYSSGSRAALLDPEIDIDLLKGKENLVLENGSYVDCGTASPAAKIEGKTYHLVVLEECQDIPSGKIRSSIHPMLASTSGTIVKVGTPNRVRSDFYESCRRNKRWGVSSGMIRHRKRNHFEYDYTVAQKYNARYKKYVDKERVRLGEDSDDFRMKYRLHWLLERGMFITPEVFDECGIGDNKRGLEKVIKGKRRSKTIHFKRPPNAVTWDGSWDGQVAAIDVGRENSTVVTIGKVWWDNPQRYGDEDRYYIHIYNWLELHGDDHESQHPQIVGFLKNYKLGQVVVDATGKGDPVYSRLRSELEGWGVVVVPFIFSAESKDLGYKVYLQELVNKRFTYPSGSRASRLQKFQRFYNQHIDLEKRWKGQRMVVSKPRGEGDDGRDDFCDSAMMLCWLVNVGGNYEVEVGPNPLVGRAARWSMAGMLKDSGAWWKGKVNPRGVLPVIRKGRRGKWD